MSLEVESNKKPRRTLWYQKFAIDVFFRCSEQRKGQRTYQDEVTFVGETSERRPIDIKILSQNRELVKPYPLALSGPCPEM